MKKVNPGFYQFLQFISPGFPKSWSRFEVLQERYVEFQKRQGRADAEIFHLAVYTKLADHRPSVLSPTFPDPAALELAPISAAVYLRALHQRLVPLKYGPHVIEITENFGLYHDLAHAYAYSQSTFSNAMLKPIPKVVEILEKGTDREMPKYFLFSGVLEDYWELQPVDQIKVKQLVAGIRPLIEKLQGFQKSTSGYSHEVVTLLKTDEATLLKDTLIQIRDLVRRANLVRYGAAAIETAAIDRANYLMDRHGNPLTFLAGVESHSIFAKSVQPSYASSIFMDVFNFLSREIKVVLELESRSLQRELDIVLQP